MRLLLLQVGSAVLLAHLGIPAMGQNPDDEVDLLIRNLESGEIAVRVKAQDQLIARGAQAVPALEMALAGKDEETAARIRKILAAIPWQALVDVEVAAILENALRRPAKEIARELAWGSEEQRTTLLHQLRGAFRPALLPFFRRFLEDPSPKLRSTGAFWLGDLGDKGSADRVARLLGDEGVTLPLILRSLGRLGGPRHAPAVERLLDHPSAEIRALSLSVLEAWNVDRACDAARRGLDREDPEEVSAAAAYLGRLGTVEDHPKLRTLADSPREDVRVAAFRALRAQKVSFERDALLKLLRKANNYSGIASEVVPLILQEGELSLEALARLLEEEINIWVKYEILRQWDLRHYNMIQITVAGQLNAAGEFEIAHAVEIMGRAKDRALLEHADRLFGHPSAAIRAAIVAALPRIDPKRAAEPVIRLLQEDPESRVRAHAAGALQDLEWNEGLEKLCFERIDREETAPTWNMVTPLSYSLLKKGGPAVVPKLIDLIRNPRTEHPDSIIRAFGAVPVQSYGLKLIEASRAFYWPLAAYLRREKDPATLQLVGVRAAGGELDGRLAAIWVLGVLAPTDKPIPVLAKALEDPEPGVQAMAIATIEESKSAKSYPELRRYLDDHRLLSYRPDPLRERVETIFSELCVAALEAGYGRRSEGRDVFEKAKAWKARLDPK